MRQRRPNSSIPSGTLDIVQPCSCSHMIAGDIPTILSNVLDSKDSCIRVRVCMNVSVFPVVLLFADDHVRVIVVIFSAINNNLFFNSSPMFPFLIGFNCFLCSVVPGGNDANITIVGTTYYFVSSLFPTQNSPLPLFRVSQCQFCVVSPGR